MNDGTNVFVFGSNQAGRHGAGAAWVARRHWGAITGVAVGREGASYAIPTKSQNLSVLPLETIEAYVQGFITYARSKPNITFLVTRIGCGLAGYRDEEIAPMFSDAPDNCELPDEWIAIFRKVARPEIGVSANHKPR